jgi:hypothetical protein
LIQGIVNTKCSFWYYDCGWAGNIHDYGSFPKKIDGGRCVMKEEKH